jgi:hypothetical protein
LIHGTHHTREISPIIIFHNEISLKKLKREPFSLKVAKLTDNDILSITVSYTGGCKKHDFILATVPLFTIMGESHQVDLVLSHENNGDACKKIVTESLYFDLFPLKETYQKVYGIKTSSMLLRIVNVSITYQFK